MSTNSTKPKKKKKKAEFCYETATVDAAIIDYIIENINQNIFLQYNLM